MNSNDILKDYHSHNSYNFNISELTKDGKEKFANYQDINSINLSQNYDSNKWTFSEKFYAQTFHFNFDLFRGPLSFNKNLNKEEFISSLKVWTINHLTTSSPSSTYRYFSNLLSIIHFTNGLNTNFDQLIDLTYNSQIYSKIYGKSHIYTIKTVKPITAKRYINSLLSFLNLFPNHKIDLTKIKNFQLAADSLKIINEVRLLPPPTDILNFKDCIEKFYLEQKVSNKEDHSRLLRFFPLILWWKLTSIIPMRPTEFCSIEYECIKEGKLLFPRFKQSRKDKNSRNILTYDALPVPTVIIMLIDEYKALTKDYGPSDQLLSFSAHLNFGLDQIKKNTDYSSRRFSKKYLNDLINKFYREIIEEEYKLAYETKLKPGDLRHISIISMMVQGYDRVQIERLAGHYEMNSHYSYTDHMQYWVDTEIQTLCTQSSLYDDGFTSPKAIAFYNQLNQNALIDNLLDDRQDNNNTELALGYCKDEDMLCPTFNWYYTGCYHCRNWGIDAEEINANKDLIISELSTIYNDLKRKVTYLAGLYNLHQYNQVGQINSSIQTKINIAQREIQETKKLVVKISNVLGVVETE